MANSPETTAPPQAETGQQIETNPTATSEQNEPPKSGGEKKGDGNGKKNRDKGTAKTQETETTATTEENPAESTGTDSQEKPIDFTLPQRPISTGPRFNTPFHRNRIVTANNHSTHPEESEALEREDGYSKNEDIKKLISDCLNGQLEANMRNERFRELGGQNLIGRIRAYLGGEGSGEIDLLGLHIPLAPDNEYVTTTETITDENGRQRVIETGTMRHHAAREFGRKTANVILRTTRTAAIGLAIGALGGALLGVTGGIGAAFFPAILGGAAARTIIESIRAGASKERRLQQTQQIIRIRYFQKAEELARRIPPEYSEDLAKERGMTEKEYNRDRNRHIKSLVNFVNSYEELAVNVAYDENGNPIIRREVLEDGTYRVLGTELQQASPVALDAEKVRDINDEFASVKKAWDKAEEYGAMIGGAAGAALHFLNGSAHAIKAGTDATWARLNNGETVRLHIDGGGFDGSAYSHDIQKVGHVAKGLQDHYVYHLRSLQENIALHRAGGHLAEGFYNANGQFISQATEYGSHVLGNVTPEMMNQAIIDQVTTNSFYQYAEVAAMIGTSGWLGRNANKFNLKHQELHDPSDPNYNKIKGYRDNFAHNQEQNRKRLLPETEIRLKPSEGEYWGTPVDPNDPSNPNLYIIHIDKIYEDGKHVEVHDYNPKVPFTESYILTMDEIMDYYRKINFQKSKDENKGTPATKVEEQKQADVTAPDEGKKKQEKEPKKLSTEKKEGRIGNFTTAAERRTPENQPIRKTFQFEKVFGNQQFAVNIRNGDRDARLDHEQLKAIATSLKEEYEKLNSQDRTNMRVALEKISKSIELNKPEFERLSWSILITTDDGKFFGYRHNNDRSELFHVREDGKITTKSKLYNKIDDKIETESKDFYEGYLLDNETLALLDYQLSRTNKKGSNDNLIKKMREAILMDKDKSLQEKLRSLIDSGSDELGDVELSAIITQYKKTTSKEAKEKVETREEEEASEEEARKLQEIRVSLKHEGEKEKEIKLAEGQILQENFPGGSIYWEVSSFKTHTYQLKGQPEKSQLLVTLKAFDLEGDNLDQKYYEGAGREIEFNEEQLRNFVRRRDFEVIAPNLAALHEKVTRKEVNPSGEAEADSDEE